MLVDAEEREVLHLHCSVALVPGVDGYAVGPPTLALVACEPAFSEAGTSLCLAPQSARNSYFSVLSQRLK